jgi:hypothetical protein
VIPCFNGAEFVGQAIESLDAQEADIEVLVVDDGSTDGTVQVAAERGARVVRHEANRGVAAAINTGVAASETELVMILGADDLLEPGAAQVLHRAAAADPESGVFIPDVDYVDVSSREKIMSLELSEPILDTHRLLAMDGIPLTCGVVFRKEVLLEHPYRPVTLEHGRPTLGSEDWQNWLELSLAGVSAVRVPGARGTVRRRRGSVSTNVARKWRSMNAVLADRRLRHPMCSDCEAAVAAGREALRGYCFNMDLVHIFGRGVRGVPYAFGVAVRDPVLAPRLLHAAAWRARDRLLGRLRD